MTNLHFFVNVSDLRDSYGGVLGEKKLAILREDSTVAEDGVAYFRLGLDFNSTQVGVLLAALRFVEADAAQLDACLAKEGAAPSARTTGCRQVDAALERRVLERVQRLVEETQAAYAESVEDDEQLLDASTSAEAESAEVWFQKQNAITVRMSEKVVCRGLLNMLKVLLPLFDMNPPALERAFKRDGRRRH